MNHLRRVFLKFYLLFANSKVEAELTREIGAHLALLEDEYLRRGMTPEDARRTARLAYGGVSRRSNCIATSEGFKASPKLCKTLDIPFANCVGTGIYSDGHPDAGAGHGGNDGDFFHRRGSMLRPLPFPDPDRLVILGDVLEGSHCASCTQSSVTAPDIRNYMRDTESFSHLGGYRQRLFELSDTGEPAAVNATRMSGEVFAALGVSPVLGRTFTQQEDKEGQQVAVLSYGTWRSRFHGDANVLREQDPSLP